MSMEKLAEAAKRYVDRVSGERNANTGEHSIRTVYSSGSQARVDYNIALEMTSFITGGDPQKLSALPLNERMQLAKRSSDAIDQFNTMLSMIDTVAGLAERSKFTSRAAGEQLLNLRHLQPVEIIGGLVQALEENKPYGDSNWVSEIRVRIAELRDHLYQSGLTEIFNNHRHRR